VRLIIKAQFPLAFLDRLFRLRQLDHVLQQLRAVIARRQILLFETQGIDPRIERISLCDEFSKDGIVSARSGHIQTCDAETIRTIALQARMFRGKLAIPFEIIVDLAGSCSAAAK
jgi:hypothetical protein